MIQSKWLAKDKILVSLFLSQFQTDIKVISLMTSLFSERLIPWCVRRIMLERWNKFSFIKRQQFQSSAGRKVSSATGNHTQNAEKSFFT